MVCDNMGSMNRSSNHDRIIKKFKGREKYRVTGIRQTAGHVITMTVCEHLRDFFSVVYGQGLSLSLVIHLTIICVI